ncbi:2-acylglycerol O-acyltransferase 1 [Orchesella cincta]|uniref:Acyltransferase n=1 Tax=Orchesella cincta TaxID=48709 RepID=A0A1D2NA40_ORCCI|nr:2-acylglycerol O-acyltransferase 1 [Orchesella cincta]
MNNNLQTPKKVLGVEFAPIIVPWERRLQTLSVFTWFLLIVYFSVVYYPFIIYSLFFSSYKTIAAVILIPYLTWVWIIDKQTCHRGARTSSYVRNWQMWKYLCDYFPIDLIKTAELDPNRNYLFCSHPHGLLCTGAFASFGTEGKEVSKLFPGFEFNILTFSVSFIFPVLREVILLLGLCSASRRSMNHVLGTPGGGKIGILIPGGAPEALDFNPGTYILQLKKRKGFVKVALQNGSPLVPVFSFGETEVYSQVANPRGSLLRTIQDKIQQAVDIPPAFFYGRGVFQYSFGFLPKRRPITVVVGAPLPMKKIPEPTQAEIDELHQNYIDALTELFYAHREKYAEDPNQVLTIV